MIGSNIGSACPGDSGGGVIGYDKTNRKYIILGIISWDRGIGGCQKTRPVVSTKVTSILTWLSKKTTESNFCRMN